jgi:manganese/iron transport system permease protein
MRRALAEVVLMGAVTGVVGTYVVLRGLSFIGDALAHAILPGIVLAYLLGQSVFLGALALGVLTSVAIAVVSQNRRVKADSAIGILFAGMFALGVVLISTTKSFSRDLASFLFGNVLAVTAGDIWTSAAAGVIVVALVAAFYRALLIASFDRMGARALGLPIFWLDLLLLLLISLTIVVSLSAVGSVLVLAMLVTPAATARLLTDRLPAMMAWSAGVSVASGVIGLFASYHGNLAAGGTIVLVATAVFIAAWLLAPTHGLLTRRAAVRHPPGAGRRAGPAAEIRAPDGAGSRRADEAGESA